MRSIVEFMADSPSRGPNEKMTSSSEFISYSQADLDIKFFQSLLVQRKVHLNACVPNFLLCITTERKVTFLPKNSPCRDHVMRIRAGVVVLGANERHPSVHIPEDMAGYVNECAMQRGTRFVVCNCGLYPDSRNDFMDGHANALVFDTTTRIVERYDPVGFARNVDNHVRKRFLEAMPGWSYCGPSKENLLQGVQRRADSFSGMCVTFCIYYVLLRLRNPDVNMTQVQTYMAQEDNLREKILRLNKFVIETLKKHERNALLRLRRGQRRGAMTASRRRRSLSRGARRRRWDARHVGSQKRRERRS